MVFKIKENNHSWFRNLHRADKRLVHLLNTSKIPQFKQIKHIYKILNQKEKKLFSGGLGAIIIGVVGLLGVFYTTNFIPTPAVGGEYTEGLIGAPQYINPILAQTNDVDADIASLVFSGLLRYDKDLQVVPDLAAQWQISDDRKVYTFLLKQNVKWHDGEPFSADDVVFTVESIKDTDFKSPLLVSLRGVIVEKVDDHTVKFTLPEPYPSFLEVLTFGILPEHIWGEIPAINANLTPYNLKPIGTGPWQFKTFTKDELGNLKLYVLVPNQNYYGQKPFLEKITFKFYPDFNTGVLALKNQSVEGLSFLPKELRSDLTGRGNLEFEALALPQYTALFFNQKQNAALENQSVRQAFALAIDKQKILAEGLELAGELLHGPLLPAVATTQTTPTFDQTKANDLLESAGWKKISREEYRESLISKAQTVEAVTEIATTDEEGAETSTSPLTETATPELPAEVQALDATTQPFFRQKDNQILNITITTVDQPENIAAANLIKSMWEEVGVQTAVSVVAGSKISREIIKPRNYQALLFGVIVGPNPDPYPFWHSSQVTDPGLNLAGLANRQADTLLEEARSTLDEATQQEKYQAFQKILDEQMPAVFLYNPTYTYVIDKKIKGFDTKRIIIPADRFNNLNNWYIKTKRQYHGGL